ncbi:X2-like carbohydrate binding domain-containing protein [Gracilibacillus sp. JCM 18860]|uniref:X2-like carbohydrate binding domain-containing protein n=1 Tax=Gracilibacillus sp. JCM 18860 TaxID=1306159 RepID=UPI003260D8D5
MRWRALRAAEDYTVSSDAVTFHQELLASVVDPNQTGNQATLTVDFSGGFDWDIDIINYQTPLLEDAVGTTESFQIPTAFNGDQLATMEPIIQMDPSQAPPKLDRL